MRAGLSARPTSCAMTYPSTSTSPVSRSTRTWTRCAEVGGARPGGTVPPCPSIGSNAAQKPSSLSASSASVRPRSGRPLRADDAVDDLEVAGRSRGAARRSAAASRVSPRPLAGRRARGVRDDAAAAHRRARRRCRVGRDDVDLVGGDAERLGGDRREAGHVPAMSTTPVTTVKRPSGSSRQIAAAGCRPPGQTPDGDPDALASGQRRPRRARAGARRARRALVEADAAPRRPVGHLVVGRDEVPPPELERVDAEPDRQLVDELLERERGLRPARGAVGAGADAVGLDAVGEDLVGVPAVRPDGQDAAMPSTLSSAKAPVSNTSRASEAAQPAVARRPEADVEDRARAPDSSSGSPRAGSARRAPGAAGRAGRRGQRLDDHVLPPNPPPSVAPVTRTLAIDRPNSLASSDRV